MYRKMFIDLPVGENLTIKKSVEIFLTFKKELNEFEVENLNFNPIKLNKMVVRFDFAGDEADQKTIDIVKNLKKIGKISNFDINKANPPSFVKAAHTLASNCIVRLSNHPEFFEEIRDNDLAFTMYFFKSLFNRINYPFFTTWDIIRKYLENEPLQEKVDVLAQLCEDLINAEKTNLENPDFIERFIHLFLVCAMIQGIEQPFWHFFSEANALYNLSEKIKEINNR